MDLSVIIVCYRGWKSLSVCLESLEAFGMKNFSMEVIVVDNNSDDGRADDFESRFGKFRFIRSNINGGYAYGCNLGASSASGNYLMILNPDTVVREAEIEKLLEEAQHNPQYGIISCRQVNRNGKQSKAYGKFPGILSKLKSAGTPCNDVTFPDWVSGSLMMMKKSFYSELGGLDEIFWMYYEDVDLCMRARKKGKEIAFFRNIVIEHNHGGSSRSDLQTTALTKCEVQISRHVYIHKHFTGAAKIIMHSSAIMDNLLTGIISGFAGLLLFFIQRLFVRIMIFLRLADYYAGVLRKKSWISKRSVINTNHTYK